MVVAVAKVVAPCKALTVTPAIGLEPSDLVIFPAIVPGVVTVKVTPLLADPPTVTTTNPVVAPEGTGAAMLVALQLVGVAAVPLKVTELDP